jgi:hypothetical protein
MRNVVVSANSSRGGTRTPDPVINSHLLYQLSYSGRMGFDYAPGGLARWLGGKVLKAQCHGNHAG